MKILILAGGQQAGNKKGIISYKEPKQRFFSLLDFIKIISKIIVR